MHDAPRSATETTPDIDMVRCAAAQLDLALADDAMQRVSAQWARLHAIAAVLAQESLEIADEPAPVFTP